MSAKKNVIKVRKSIDNRIDQLEVALIKSGDPIDCPVTHRFVPGMYIREIFMPKGVDGVENIVTSLVHNTTHPFFVLQGKVADVNGLPPTPYSVSGFLYLVAPLLPAANVI